MFTLFLMPGFDLFILAILSCMLPFYIRYMIFLLREDARGNLGRMFGMALLCIAMTALILNLAQIFHDTAFLSLRSTYSASGAGFLAGLVLLILSGRLVRHINRTEPHQFF